MYLVDLGSPAVHRGSTRFGGGGKVVAQVVEPLYPRSGDDGVLLRQQPGQRDLHGRDPLANGQVAHEGDQSEIGFQRLRSEAGKSERRSDGVASLVSRMILPVRKPFPSGHQETKPIPSGSHSGRSADSGFVGAIVEKSLQPSDIQALINIEAGIVNARDGSSAEKGRTVVACGDPMATAQAVPPLLQGV